VAVPVSVREEVARQAQASVAALASLLDGARTLDQILVRSPFDTWGTLKILSVC